MDLGFVHQFVPAATGDTQPTLLLLHGTGGNETDLHGLGRALAPGAALLSPRGKVLENGMPRFFRRLAEGILDIPDLIERTHELAAFVEGAAPAYGFDPRAVVAAGYSNGANIAASMLLLRPGTLRAAVLFRPMVPLVPESPPNLSGTSVFVAAGHLDPIVPRHDADRLVELLESYGAEVVLEWQETGHGLTADEVRSANRWLGQLHDQGA